MSSVLKCKMCGGDIEANEQLTVGVCKYCGSTMTIPHIDSDKKARLFNWANQLRLNNEFDKAYEAYREIVSEDTEEAEAYWGMLLSEYGVEYVENPKTKKRVPTCHRTIEESIKSTVNFEMACKYADIESRFIYKNEADALDKIQKKIKSISSQQEQYDVFICYKEFEDESGDRTADSVLAQDIYDELSKKGFNTFFSRITLRDKLGEDYEPYIYSALKSAKVMVVVATSVEHCEAPWVRNEWSRFLAFMSEDTDKKIIPVYKNITAYELPDELSSYQAQDLSKMGALQDLVLGIESLLRNRDATKKTMSEQDVLSIVKENKEKERRARKTKIKASAQSMLKYIAIVAAVVLVITGIIKGIQFVNKAYIQPNKTYKAAISKMENKSYSEAIDDFKSIEGYKNSSELMTECTIQKSIQDLKNGIEAGNVDRVKAQLNTLDSSSVSPEILESLATLVTSLIAAEDIDNAVSLAETIDGWSNSENDTIQNAINDAYVAKEKAELEKKKEEQKNQYDHAEQHFANNTVREFGIALSMMSSLAEDQYENSAKRLVEMEQAIYEIGLERYNLGKYTDARSYFALLSDYSFSDSAAQVVNCDTRMQEDEQDLYDKMEQLAGTWKGSNSFNTHIKFIHKQDNAVAYEYDVGNGWNNGGSVIYNKKSDDYYFTWVSAGNGYSIKLNGSQMTITSTEKNGAGFFEGTYRKISD